MKISRIHNELFFALSVLVGEGATEKVVLPRLFQALGHDLNRIGISIVDVGGKTKLPLFATVCKVLDIPFVILADHDVKEINPSWGEKRRKEECSRNAKQKRWNRDIEKACPANALSWMKPDFESELGPPHNEAEKIDRAIERFSGATADDVPAVLRPVIG